MRIKPGTAPFAGNRGWQKDTGSAMLPSILFLAGAVLTLLCLGMHDRPVRGENV